MKIHPVAADLIHADQHSERRTDMAKLIVTVRNFAKAASKSPQSHILIQIVHRFYSCYTRLGGRTEGQDKSNWYIFSTFRCDRDKYSL
jgi:hypothetical protein